MYALANCRSFVVAAADVYMRTKARVYIQPKSIETNGSSPKGQRKLHAASFLPSKTKAWTHRRAIESRVVLRRNTAVVEQ